jgi:hypothetical protein
LLATLCVTLSLALFALGDADSTGGFCLRTLRFGRPMTNVGPILDVVVIPRAVVVGTTCEESWRCVNMALLFLVRAHCFTSSVVTLRGYEGE